MTENISSRSNEDIIEKNVVNDAEFLQKIQKLEDVEMLMNRSDVTRNKPKYVYSKDELLKIRSHPLSMKMPDLRENLKNIKKDKDDDLKKTQMKKHGLTRNLDQNGDKFELKKNENVRGQDKLSNKNRNENEETVQRKLADPKERLRKEQQDICLSPQRKSFNTGCYVANNAKSESTTNNNSNKPSTESRENRENKENKNFREGQRRIGSGRIISRDPRNEIRNCYPETGSSAFPEYHQNHQNHQNLQNRIYSGANKEIPTVVYERRFQGNLSDKEKDRIWDRQKAFGHFDKRIRFQSSREEEEEPEWMKEGPISLNDVIELKGFDEHEEKIFRGGKHSKINSRIFHKVGPSTTLNSVISKTTVNGKEQADKRNSESDTSSIASDTVMSKNQDVIEQKLTTEKKANKIDAKSFEIQTDEVKQPETTSIQLDLEEILRLDLLPDVSSNTDSKESAGSKFARWFKHRDDTNISTVNGEQNSRAFAFSKETTDKHLGGIAPVTSSHGTEHVNNASSSNLLGLLRGSQDNSVKMNMRVLEASGKLHSVEEIEAKLRGADSSKDVSVCSANDRKKKEEEAEAFKKLLSQAFQSNDADRNLNDVSSHHLATQKTKNEKKEFGKLEGLCNGERYSNFNIPVPQVQMGSLTPAQSQIGGNNVQSTEMMKLFQMQQNKHQQEVLSKMLMSNSTNYNVPPPSANVRQSNSSATSGSFSNVTQEMQMMINSIQPTREIMNRPETVNIFKALRNGEISQYQLVEQLKKTPPYQTKFRESVLCVLKYLQSQYYNSTVVLGSPVGMSLNMPPPPIPSTQSYSENVIQQMLNSQYRNGLSNNIIYQREFNTQNQNMYQNSALKKHLADQSPNINQIPGRMNSPATVMTSPSSTAAAVQRSSTAQDDSSKNVSAVPTKSSSTSSSFSMLPTSVLRNKAAEKENLDTFSKDATESKPGEKNSLIPYNSSSGGNQCSGNAYNVVDRFNNFGTCIPPPAISGQYFVGNMIRPTSLPAQVPIFGSTPSSLLARVSVAPNSTAVLSRGSPKVSANTAQQYHHPVQMRNANSLQMFMNNAFNSNSNRSLADSNLSSAASNFVSSNILSRNTSAMNGLLSSPEDSRWISSENPQRSISTSSSSPSTVTLQTIMSVEEIERFHQSVPN